MITYDGKVWLRSKEFVQANLDFRWVKSPDMMTDARFFSPYSPVFRGHILAIFG